MKKKKVKLNKVEQFQRVMEDYSNSVDKIFMRSLKNGLKHAQGKKVKGIIVERHSLKTK